MRTLNEVALEFCSLIEQTGIKEQTFSDRLSRILAELVYAVLRIPDDGLADAGAENYERRDYDEIRAALPQLPFQHYREIFDAFDWEDDEPVVGDLYDDLADIYRDLSEGLFIHQHVSNTEAERYWRQSFRYHWGEHATSALRALYWAHRNQPYEFL